MTGRLTDSRRHPHGPALLLAPVLLALALAGCDSETAGPAAAPGSGSPVVTDPPAVSYARHVVTPSLGLVLNGTVRILALDGTELAKAYTDSTGTAALELPESTVGPFIVELAGNEAAQYYDEALDALVALAPGQRVRAVVADLAAQGTGVTPLTEMAVRYLEQQHGSLAGVTAGQIAAANEFVRTQLAPELDDITLPPTLVGSIADATLLANAHADLYALKLAALARVAAANNALATTPALDILEEMAADLADGALDGNVNGSPALPATYDLGTFATQLLALAQSYTGNATLDDWLGALSGYVSPQILALLTPPGGGGGGGDGGGGGVTLPGPGDLLSSWAGNYGGTWSGTITNSGSSLLFGTLNSLLGGAVNTALNITGGACAIAIGDDSITIGGQTIAFDPALAVAATGGARTYALPATFDISVLGISLNSNGYVTLSTGDAAVRSATVTLSAGITGLFGASASGTYTGTCTFP